MNMALGFGSNETDFEEQERKFVEDFINVRKEKDEALDWFRFPDEMREELKLALKERKNEYKKKSEEYKTSENYPDRYSTYYFTVLGDLHNIVVIFDFSHINRRHPMSPDGWAVMNTKQVYLFEANV